VAGCDPLEEWDSNPSDDPDLIAALAEEVRSLRARRDELLALVASISQSEPLPDEVQHALSRQGSLLAEVGTLRAALREACEVGLVDGKTQRQYDRLFELRKLAPP
jgi:hypothetical protein